MKWRNHEPWCSVFKDKLDEVPIMGCEGCNEAKIRRELFQRVIDHDPRLITAMHMFHQFHRCNEMLKYLIDNRITGRELFYWTLKDFDGSAFRLARFVLSKVKKADHNAPVIGGSDFIL